MARDQNFLLGNGEKLTVHHDIRRNSRKKNPPYTIGESRDRLIPKLRAAVEWVDKLPPEACPNDEVVLKLTLHPRYIAKSDHPDNLLKAANLRPIGRRATVIKPDKWGTKKEDEAAATDEIFVSTPRNSLRQFAAALPNWTAKTVGADELTQIERLEPFRADEKLRGIPSSPQVILELVLHTSGDSNSIKQFQKYAKSLGAEVVTNRQHVVGGLSFAPVRAPRDAVPQLAQFALVRVLRGMPTIRPLPTALTRAVAKAVSVSSSPARDESIRAVIFDGGLPAPAVKFLRPWVRYIEPLGIGKPLQALQEHGLAVTSSFLFGPLDKSHTPGEVYCPVDHVRVLDDAAGSDYMYFDVLERILSHLDGTSPPYRFINLSLGPPLPVTDDEITVWTAELDSRLANGNAIMTVAAGNDGEKDASMNLNRIQPPSDGVNVISVGAANSIKDKWTRAPYSCVGPGRCPGFVKPDGLAFGGSDTEMFGTVGESLTRIDFAGTSFAAPYVLRAAAGVASRLETQLSPLALRALLIHRAQRKRGQKQPEVGWGRFHTSPELLTTCDDTEALVIYQGDLPISKHLRARLPMPDTPIGGNVRITATLVIAPEVDAENPSTYTRGGLQVTFRPNDQIYDWDEDSGKPSKEPAAGSFFSRSGVYRSPEFELRTDGHKWEPCLRESKDFDPKDLSNPVFDIYYHHREKGRTHSEPTPLPYALIVSLSAPDVPDLYSRVVRTYAGILVAVTPKTSVVVPARVSV